MAEYASGTVRGTAKLLELKRKIEGLSPGDRLRLCAGLIEQGEYDLAETLAGTVVDELRLVRIQRRKP